MMTSPTSPRTSGEVLALLYDWEHDDYRDDLDFYAALAKRTGGPVLELACGSGRVLRPLAELGLEVVGVDVSPAMLARARGRLHGTMARACLKNLDMTRELPPGPFGLVIFALHAFGFAFAVDDQVRLLERIAARLGPGGLVALDLIHPATVLDPPSGVPVLQRAGWCEELGAEVAKWMVQDVSLADERIDLTCLYDVIDKSGALRRLTDRVEMRFFARFEIELLCRAAGLEIEGVYGGYELEPCTDASDRMIVLAGARR